VVDFMLSGGNTDDRKPVQMKGFIDKLKKYLPDRTLQHRSSKNFMTNLFSALIANNFTEKKTSLKTTFVDTNQLNRF